MIKKSIIFLSPLILFIEIMVFSFITELMRQPSDITVILGVLCICLSIMLNFFLVKFIIKQFKKTI